MLATALSYAAAPATGTIEGRVLNPATGTYVNNARVFVSGTTFETFTDNAGEFRLSGIPAGEIRLTISYTGFPSVTVSVQTPAGGLVRKEIELGAPGGPEDPTVVKLDAFVVASHREENAAAIASHEQRYASNIKNVVAADAFGDVAEGNFGEFIKYVPGVVLDYSGDDARTISLRGMPSDATPVLIDGNRMASAVSSTSTRSVEVSGLNMNNIARVEVSKSPTPDAPADSLGGTVNVINKSAFDRRQPLFSYHVHVDTNTNIAMTFKKVPSSMPETSVRRVQPGFDFSYVAPFSRTFGITLNGLWLQRFSNTKRILPAWRPAWGGTTFAPPERPFLNVVNTQDQPTWWQRGSLGATADWRFRPNDVLSLGVQYSMTSIHQGLGAWNTSITGTLSRAPAGYDQNFVLSAPGAGSSTIDTATVRKLDSNVHTSLKYRHNGPVWQIDGGAFSSRSTNTYGDIDRGHFRTSTALARNLTLRYSDINTAYPGPKTVTATTTTGTPVPLFELASYTLQAASSAQKRSSDYVSGASLNARRDLPWRAPLSLRTGLDVRRQDRDIRTSSPSWTFVGPDGVALSADDAAARYDVINTGYSNANALFDLPHIQRIDPYKMWKLYQQHPGYFVLDEAAQHIADTGASQKLVETVSAGYLRGDLRLLDNRLTLVGGGRYERTTDDGYGRLNDTRAIYQQDAAGNLILGANGRPVQIPGTALALARRQYVDRGAHSRRSYGGFYPSLNAKYAVTDSLLARAAYARTIGRPNLGNIIPNTTVASPTATDAARIITTVNSGLKPWTADNLDVSIERYFAKRGRIAIGGFYKDIKEFFTSTRTPATPELLRQFGLSDDYLDYDVVSKGNGGDAKISGLEFDYQQSLADFLPKWAGGIVVFFNLNRAHLWGSNAAADFSGFTSESTNVGVSFDRGRFGAKLSLNHRGRRRLAPQTGTNVPADAYVYNQPWTTVNLNAEYRLSRRLTLYGVARGITDDPSVEERYGSVTPEYARISSYQVFGTQISVGIKGEF